MFLTGLGTATPPQRWTQTQCWDALVASEYLPKLNPRSQAILRKVLRGNNGICSRFPRVRTTSAKRSTSTPTCSTRVSRRTRPPSPRGPAERALADAGHDAGRHRRGHHQHVHGLSLPRADELRQRADGPADRHPGAGSGRTGLRRGASRTCATADALIASGRAPMCCRFASRSAAPPCTWTTIRACSSARASSATARARPCSDARAAAGPPADRVEVCGHAAERGRS